ncbi:MAG: thermonuclease family protein [Candidatus Thermoplasmatota archaeon]
MARRRRTVRIGSLLLTAIVLAVSSAAYVLTQPPAPGGACRGTARCFTATVTNIVDGDTLDVGDDRIRLALVNTPEAWESGYQAAKDFTATMCPVGSQARVDEDDGQTGGSYGRIVAVVYCGGKNLNAALVDAGLAVVLSQYCAVSEFAGESWAAACR